MRGRMVLNFLCISRGQTADIGDCIHSQREQLILGTDLILR